MSKPGALDLLTITGLALLSAGSWMVYQPAGLIVPGAILTGICCAAMIRKREK